MLKKIFIVVSCCCVFYSGANLAARWLMLDKRQPRSACGSCKYVTPNDESAVYGIFCNHFCTVTGSLYIVMQQ